MNASRLAKDEARMRLTRYNDYALRVLMYLPDRRCSISKISDPTASRIITSRRWCTISWSATMSLAPRFDRGRQARGDGFRHLRRRRCSLDRRRVSARGLWKLRDRTRLPHGRRFRRSCRSFLFGAGPLQHCRSPGAADRFPRVVPSLATDATKILSALTGESATVAVVAGTT